MPKLPPLRLVFRPARQPERVQSPGAPAGEKPPLQVEFVAYAEDCLLSGYIGMDTDRLTDLLDQHDEFQLIDVFAQDLSATKTGTQIASITVKRDELLLIHAGGPRGDRGRRRRTRQHPVAIGIGPYQVRGYLHVLPGSDPISSFRHRRPMVPLTDAWVEYVAGGTMQRRQVGTLIVNRQLVDWIVEAVDEEVEIPEIPLSAYPKGPLLKDFTEHFREQG